VITAARSRLRVQVCSLQHPRRVQKGFSLVESLMQKCLQRFRLPNREPKDFLKLVSSREVDVREDAVVQNAEDMSYEFLSHIPLRCSEEDFGVLYQRPTHCWD